MDTSSIEYKKAFEAYIRYGTPIDLSLKQARTTTHYIWRTRGDGKVRPSHAANDGKIFAWDDPPPTGHPGEDYNCRCTAEPYYAEITERIDITLSGVSDTGTVWSSEDFVNHYRNGDGRGVTLRQTGNLRSVVKEYSRIVIDDPKRLPTQIADIARKSKNGSFWDDFYKSYNMKDIVFSLGKTTIGGEFSGIGSEKNGILTISGKLDFYLKDEFKDPYDIYNLIPGTFELFGKIYPIYDKWQGRFNGVIYLDPNRSKYS